MCAQCAMGNALMTSGAEDYPGQKRALLYPDFTRTAATILPADEISPASCFAIISRYCSPSGEECNKPLGEGGVAADRTLRRYSVGERWKARSNNCPIELSLPSASQSRSAISWPISNGPAGSLSAKAKRMLNILPPGYGLGRTQQYADRCYPYYRRGRVGVVHGHGRVAIDDMKRIDHDPVAA